MLIPVIIAGGAGSRLWPVSRETHPKPFIDLPDGDTLLAKTYRRAMALPNADLSLTVTNKEYFFKTRDEYIRASGSRTVVADFVLEPLGRNTAPAVAAAAFRLLDTFGEDVVMLVLPADHLINDQAAFESAVDAAYHLAKAGNLVTFGIKPEFPETGFGYIGTGAAIDGCERGYLVSEFVEKPTLDVAEKLLAEGAHYWNSGMFCFSAQTFLNELEKHAHDVFKAVDEAWTGTDKDIDPVVLNEAFFKDVPGISIDYAVMEKSSHVAMVAGEFDWSDIGSWSSIAELTVPDDNGNRVDGEARLVDTRNCYVKSERALIAAVGVEDLLIIDTEDAVLIAKQTSAQDVKKIVEGLKAENHQAYKFHRTVARPWGTYTVLEEGERFKIKRIVVKPGASLSLQMHHHRSEHWVVVGGMARVTNGESEKFVRTDESTYIPSGTRHRLENPGVVDLVMIEVQTGDYLGEDDIVRFDDMYGRR